MTDDALLARMARAMNKSRFYDTEPEMYKDLEEFWAQQYPEHIDEAEFMARAALAAIRESGYVISPAAALPSDPRT